MGLEDDLFVSRLFFSLNKGFNGVLEMLHLNSLIAFPKKYFFFSPNNFDKKYSKSFF